MKPILAFFLFPLLCFADPQQLTTVIETKSSKVTGAYTGETDCHSKQAALRLQLKVCLDHQTLSSCLDQFYPPLRKKFPKCAEEFSAACLDACANNMTYSFCAKYCK